MLNSKLKKSGKLILAMSIALWASAEAAVPGIPTLSYPLDMAKNISVYANLKWRKTAGALTYRLQVGTDSAFASTFFDDSTLTDTLKQMRTMADSTVYYWRVQAANTEGAGPFSKTRSFTTTPPAVLGPTLVSPANYSVGASLTPTLTWNTFPGATAYTVQVATVSNFTPTIFSDTSVKDTTLKLTIAMTKGTVYFWHVRAKAGGLNTQWTKFSFTTLADPPTDAANQLLPADAATDLPMPTLLSWGDVTSAMFYRVEVSSSADFSALVKSDSVDLAWDNVDSLIPQTQYYWRVKGCNSGGCGPLSTVRSFKVTDQTAVRAGANAQAADFRLVAGAGRGMQFEFFLPRKSAVNITAFSVTGGRPVVLADGILEAGSHRTAASQGPKTAGLYVVRMQTESLHLTKRVFLP